MTTGVLMSAMLERRLGRFVLTGAATALLFFGLSLLFVAAGLTPFLGSVAAYAAAFAVGYSAQRNWTFRARHGHARALPRYVALQAACALCSGAIAHGATHMLGLAPVATSIVTTGLVGFIAYVASSLWVFPNVETDAK
jgi:putative flippase GtrA